LKTEYEKSFHARTVSEWRTWLEANHENESFVWLILYKKDSDVESITYSDAVDEALCFGWVDSKPNKRDDESYYVYFAQRNPKSNWSRINKEKIARMMKEKRMHASGVRLIEQAKRNGAWNALDDVENLVIPDDLDRALRGTKDAHKNFAAFPDSSKRGILEWILNAKRPETRQKRIDETATLAGKNIRANHYRQPKGKA